MPNPDSAIITLANLFPLLQNPAEACFTPFQLTLSTVHSDLVCSCLAMEAHLMKFLMDIPMLLLEIDWISIMSDATEQMRHISTCHRT